MRKSSFNLACPKETNKIIFGSKIGTIITTYLSNIRFATAIFISIGRNVLFFRAVIFNRRGVTTVISNVGEERKPRRTTEASVKIR
jgi:hypothetical protein